LTVPSLNAATARLDMNWPNRLTITRFFLTVLFVIALSSALPFTKTAALLLFILASITDYVDGAIARRFGLITDFGKLMDPLVDKIMMAAAFICLVPLGAVPEWVAVIIISREFLITGLRLLASSKGKVLPAEGMGKHKTVWQIVTILFFLTLLSIVEIVQPLPPWWNPMWRFGGTALIAVAVIFTLYSGVGYLWKNRGLITQT
jgi:CDP-diacylglycerol---glycerol-3-phosphate 3-phosphatidyltransferase